MHITFLNPIAQMGGAERSLLDILASLRQAEPGWKLSLVLGEAGPLLDLARQIGVDPRIAALPPELARVGDAASGGPAGNRVGKTKLLCRLGAAGMTGARYIGSLRSVLRKLRPDVVHTHGFKMHVLGAWAKPSGTPLIWHVHDYVQTRPVMTRLLRLHAGLCSAAIANSASVGLDVRAACGPALPIHLLWNAVDLAEFAPEGTHLDLDAASGLPPAAAGVVRFGLVGTLARWKGHEAFLRAFAMLPPDLPARGYIVGGRLYRTDASQYGLDELRRMAAGLGLTGRVGFTGFVPRSAQAMRTLDVVVHASTQPEPFGLVIAEGMACGRAVIVSRSGGAAELTSDGVNALAHRPGDVRALAALMVRLAGDRDLRERLGRTGRQTAVQDFDRARLGRQLAPIYRSVVPENQAKAA